MGSRTAVCLTRAVADFLHEAGARDLDHGGRICAGREAISRAVVEGHDLAGMWRESDPDKRLPGNYRRHQVVRDPEYGFTVVVLLWEPGASTPVHDHATWCVFGVLEGALEVTDYEITTDDGRSPLLLAERGRTLVGAGLLGDNRDPAQEVHRVRNTGTARAVSLHVYGADLTQRTLFGGRGIRIVEGEGRVDAQGAPAY